MRRELNQSDPFNTDYFSEYYKNYRDKEEDLFDSERHFIEKFINNIDSVLDVGCATGGMLNILSNFKKDIKYEGIDISKNLIKIASRNYPNIKFNLGDGSLLMHQNNSYDGIISFGTTVHDQNWKNLLSQCYRVAKKSFLFDIRLTRKKTLSKINECFVLDGSGIKYPYIVINIWEFLEFLKSLDNNPMINIYGYSGKANKDVTMPSGYENIFMCGILLEKVESNSKRHGNNINIDIPIELLL